MPDTCKSDDSGCFFIIIILMLFAILSQIKDKPANPKHDKPVAPAHE